MLSDKDKSGRCRWNEVSVTVMAVALFAVLALCRRDSLLKLESVSLFLYTPLFFTGQMCMPGGFLTYSSAFLTQFLHIPVLGALICTLLALLLTRVSYSAFRLNEGNRPLALVLPVSAFAIMGGLGYEIFMLKDIGFFFAPLLGLLGMGVGICLFRKFKSSGARIIYTAIWCFAGFAVMGLYASLATVAMMIVICREEVRTSAGIAITVIFCLLLCAVPYMWYLIYSTDNPAGIYLTGLPDIPGVLKHFWCPYLFIVVSVILLALLSTFPERTVKLKWQLLPIALSVVQTLVITAEDPVFKAENTMAMAADRCNWERIIETAEKFEKRNSREPSRAMRVYLDLALLKTGRENEAFSFTEGSGRQNAVTHTSLTLQCGKRIYYHYGMTNFSYRWCVEDCMRQGETFESLKYMILSSVAGGMPQAEELTELMRHTLFYRKWAERLGETAYTPDVTPLIIKKNELAPEEPLLEISLLNHFTGHLDDVTSAGFDRIALYFALKSKQPGLFWNHFVKYMNSNRPSSIPEKYQEALLLFDEIASIPAYGITYSDSVLNRWSDFLQLVETNEADRVAGLSFNEFGRTFWYYYYFVNDIKTF